jgi:hypothetical protein
MKWTREFLHLECFLGICAGGHLQGVVGGVVEGPGAAHGHPEDSAVLEDGLTHVLGMMPCWFFKPKLKNCFPLKILQKGTASQLLRDVALIATKPLEQFGRIPTDFLLNWWVG